MIEAIQELEQGLRKQMDALANDIRQAESALITTKEGYLKVQGALEILAILKSKVTPETKDDVAAAIALE
jgi:phosphopantetheinyl transferase